MPRYGHIGVLIGISGAALAALLLLMVVTNPVAVGPLGVTLWFVIFLAGVSAVFTIVAFMVGKRFESHATEGQLWVSARRRGVMAGIYLTVLLALNSLEQLNLRDAILLLILLVLTEFYVVART